MPDDSTKRRPPDANRVNIHDHWEIDFWCRKIGCTRAQLIVAVHTVGPVAATVSEYLRETTNQSRLQDIATRNAIPAAPPPPSASL